MNSLLIGISMAMWFGILTSISPCPLTTNILAMSYIGRKVNNTRYVLVAGILYTLGRVLAYIVLGSLLMSFAQFTPGVSQFLQEHMRLILGPLLILVGIILLDLIKINLGGNNLGTNLQKRVDRAGIWGAGIMGIAFALSFCPVSAALFFGSLFSLSLKYESPILIPSLYGIGTAIPVLAFVFLLVFSVQLVGRVFNKLSVFEVWARKTTAMVFIIVGIYYIWSSLVSG
jgi:cytochrome c biogenesis protein CcdA